MLTLEPITRGIRDGRHQHYPTPDLEPREVATEADAEETAVKMLAAYQSISYLQLVDGNGTKVRDYQRSHFFMSDSPLRHVRQRVVDEEIAEWRAVRA